MSKCAIANFQGQYSLTENLKMDVRLLGLAPLLSPFLQMISSQRVNMFCSNVAQALVVDHGEIPNICSGFEERVGRETFNETRRTQPVQVITVIPKYLTNAGADPIPDNRNYTMIYVGTEDGIVRSFDISEYTKCTDGFGYMNNIGDTRLWKPGRLVYPHEMISSSPIVSDGEYRLGVNANVCFCTDQAATDDAIRISQSLADKLVSTAIHTVNIQIPASKVPLNLYGKYSGSYKIFPDIGEEVDRETGIICAFRDTSNSTMMSDMNMAALETVQPLHDDVYYGEPGAIILDVDVYRNTNSAVLTSPEIFAQIEKYHQNIHTFYYKEVVKVYNDILKRIQKEALNWKIGNEFNSLVTRCMGFMIANNDRVPNIPFIKRKPPKLAKKKEEIPFLNLVITYMYKRKITPGSKLTGRAGDKGVVSVITPDEDMPVDDFGNRADMSVSADTVPNRMSYGQWYEQEINMVSEVIRKRIVAMGTDYDSAYSLVLEYLRDINPRFACIVHEAVTNNLPNKARFIEGCKKQITLVCPPALETINTELILYLIHKYEVPISPIEFNLRDADGNLIRRVRTKQSIPIGSKYIYLLCKVPHVKASGVGYVSQHGTPVHPSKQAKACFPISQTPIRFGEDEIRNLIMAVEDPMTVQRIMALYANSTEGLNKLVETLLTHPNPSNIDHIDISTETLMQTNRMIQLGRHLMSTCGVDMVNVNVEEQEQKN